MSTILTIGGSTITMSILSIWPKQLTYRFRGYSSLTLERRGGPLQTLPDPYLGKPLVLAMSGATVHAGDITDMDPHYTEIGWVTTYQCRDLKARCDRVPLTDSNTLTDTAAFNLQFDDPLVIASRQGRTAGQIVTEVLTMVGNATNLNARGVGGYTSMGPPPVLPSSTVADLALLTIVPPNGCFVQGEKLISAIEQFLQQWAPNFYMWIEPDTGALRFYDQRATTGHTLTMGTDPIDVTPLHRSIGDNFQRVVVRGQPIAERMVVSTLDGGLAEHFDYVSGGSTVSGSAAKAAWSPAQALFDKTAKSEGTCTCTDTLDVVVHATDAAQVWGADDWDQTATGHQGVIDLYASGGAGLVQWISRRVASNAAHTAGSSSNVVLDMALPATNYDSYKLYGVSNGLGWCWKRYTVVNTDVAHAMTRQLTYPAPWVGANGGIAVMTSYPMGSVCWSSSGSPPFEERPASFTFDPTAGTITFLQPTFVTAGYHVPSDVRALLAVNTGELVAIWPANTGGPPATTPAYGGTSNSVEGLTETLTVTCLQWRDPANSANMLAYAHDLFDSVKDTIVEGQIVYHGLYNTALAAGQGYSVTGSTYSTGYEGLNLPAQEVSLYWNFQLGQPITYTTVISVSNRRAHYTSEAFLRPDRTLQGQFFDFSDLASAAAEQGMPMGGRAYQAGLGAYDAAGAGVAAARSSDTAGVGSNGMASGADPLSQAADPLSSAIDQGQPGMANADISAGLQGQQSAAMGGGYGVGIDQGLAGDMAGQAQGSDPSPRAGPSNPNPNPVAGRGAAQQQVAADHAGGE